VPRKILSISEALSNPMRRRILVLLWENPGVSLRQLAKRLGIGMGNLSGHLLILERVGLIKEVRKGRRLEIYLNTEVMDFNRKVSLNGGDQGG